MPRQRMAIRLIGVGVGAKVVVEPVEKVVAVEFVAAGVALPVPLAVRALGPAGFVDLPEFVALGFFAVALGAANAAGGYVVTERMLAMLVITSAYPSSSWFSLCWARAVS